MTQPILELRQISISFSNRTLIQDLDLSIAKNQHLGLYAPNGSGKTTLLRTIMGFVPYEGSITFQGQEIHTEADFKTLRRHVGLVLQEARDQIFFPEVLEDVCFGPLNLGLSTTEAQQRALDVLASLGIDKLAGKQTAHLSGGERRLVALAGILAMQPDILFLDEPTSGLDQAAMERLLHVLHNLPQARLIVSHDPLFLQHVADQFYTISHKHLLKMDKPVSHSHEHAHFGGDIAHNHADNFDKV